MSAKRDEWLRCADNARHAAASERRLAAVQRSWAADTDRLAQALEQRVGQCLRLAEQASA